VATRYFRNLKKKNGGKTTNFLDRGGELVALRNLVGPDVIVRLMTIGLINTELDDHKLKNAAKSEGWDTDEFESSNSSPR
jgi:hypothetical protein